MRSTLAFILFALGFFVLSITPASAGFEPIDGKYDAQVKVNNKIYRTPVEVKQGRVAAIVWSNGAVIKLINAPIHDGKAEGKNADGISFIITITNLEYEFDDHDGSADRRERKDFDD